MKISATNLINYEAATLRAPIQRVSSSESRPSTQTVDEFLSSEAAFREEQEKQKDDLFADTFDFSVTDFIEWVVDTLDLSDHLGYKRKKKKQNNNNDETEEEQETEGLSLVA